LLIGGGTLFLLQNLGFVPEGLQVFWALVFAVGAVLFLVSYAASPTNWWAAIPGFALLGLAIVLTLDRLAPAAWGDVGGILFLGALAIGFLAVYIRQRHHWWALFPAGVLMTLTAVAGSDQVGLGEEGGTIFFFGLGLTFALIALIGPQGNRRWALFPALFLLIMALLVSGPGERLATIAWPIVLIGGGLFLLLRRPRREAPHASEPPASAGPNPPVEPGATGP
jgi:hypothetical protein